MESKKEAKQKEQAPKSKKEEHAAAPQQPAKRKLGSGLLAEMMARGTTELAVGLSLHGYVTSNTQDVGTVHDQERCR